MAKRLLVLCVIGLLVFGFTLLATWAAGYQVYVLQVAVSDWFMISANGPRLGTRPVRDDLTLVLFDTHSAAELGHIRSYENDLQLYENLFAAGAKCIYDARPVAAADDATFAEVQPLLDGMLAIRDDGLLTRDAYLGPDILSQTHPLYTPLLAQNLVNSSPQAIASIRSRFYPMFCLTSVGLIEAAPLQIVRHSQGLAPADLDTVAEGVRSAGVMSAWHQQAPDMVPESDTPASPYALADRQIPWYPFLSSSVLVPPAAFWVSYDPDVNQYPSYSYVDMVRDASTGDFTDQIVIIGYSSEPDVSPDSYTIPSVSRKASAAEVVAAATQTLLDQHYMREPHRGLNYAILAALCVGFAIVGGWLRPERAVVVTLAGVTLYFLCAVLAYRSGWYADFVINPSAALLSGVLGLVYSSWLSVRARQRVVDLFGRYVPRAVVNQLMLKPDLNSLLTGGVKQDVSVMFADIRGFTTFSEDLPPEDVVQQLNSLLEIMVECVFENEGTLDKFIGDAILVLFNAPLPQQDHVRRSVRTAIQIQRRLAAHPSGLSVGIGLHRGDAVVGNIGTQRRLEYTAIGSTVNIASRLCGVAEPGEVILSEAMVADLGDEFLIEPLPPVTVKGLKAPLAAYRVRLVDESPTANA